MPNRKNNDIMTFSLILLILIIVAALSIVFINTYDFMNSDLSDKKDIKVATSMGEEKAINKSDTSNSNKETNDYSNAKNPLDNIQDPNKQNNNNSTASLDKFYYNQLDTYGKQIYYGIHENESNIRSGNYVIDFGTKFSDVLNSNNGSEILNTAYQSAWDAYACDNPSLFYLDATKMYLNIKSTTKGNKTTHAVNISSGSNPNYYAKGFQSKQQVDQCLIEIETIRNQINQSAKGNDYEKIKYIHNWLVDNISYDKSLSKNNTHNVYGALREKEVVCEGYAKAFKYLLDGLNIPCIMVTGVGVNSNGESESHAWNYVQINNMWYAVDVTWDDPIIVGGGKASEKDRYAYFLKGERTISKNHVISQNISPVGMKFSYPTLSSNDY